MYKINNILYLTLIIFIFASCNKSEEEKFNQILNSENLEIQINGYGGIAGYFEQKLYLKKNEFESLIIIDKGTDYQTFVRIDNERKLLKEFIVEAYKTNEPDKKHISSCIGGIDYEYILKSGLTKLKLKPSRKCDSIFDLILKYE
ncbi:conserved hypothetical protein [Tenacibaculum dicentrarchi]|uniref:Lipoprotein n=1 Tax=Tenacibaculum dicentrarchi TaxID=669041 RepID=A0ABM9NXG1_9FLAO|nr:conserved hypothetical protein [Tenacibaculum dicentrarchi]